MIGIKGICLVVIKLGCPYNQFSHDICHERLCLLGCLLHLLMTDLHWLVETAEIGDDRDTEGADATMVGHNHFGHSGHADGIATHDPIHLIFRRGLEGRTLYAHIHAMLNRDALLAGDIEGQLDQQRIISAVHVGKARTRGEVLTTKRMLGEEINVIGDDHQIADIELRVHAASGIRHKESLDAQFVHDTHGEGYLLHRVALVVMEAPLHGQNIHATQFAEDQFSAMSLNGRDREIRNVGIGDLGFISNF